MSDYLTNDVKHAKNLLHWQVEAVQSDGDLGSDTIAYKLDFHICTEEDRKKFYTPSPTSRIKIDMMFSNGGMLCLSQLDWKGENLKLFGKSDLMAHRRIDLNLVACNPLQITEQNKHLNSTECLVDLTNKTAIEEKRQKTIKYLAQPHVTMIYNTERINIMDFEEKTVV